MRKEAQDKAAKRNISRDSAESAEEDKAQASGQKHQAGKETSKTRQGPFWRAEHTQPYASTGKTVPTQYYDVYFPASTKKEAPEREPPSHTLRISGRGQAVQLIIHLQ